MNDIPRPEHPRPDFERRLWQNLNGEWQFAVDTQAAGIENGWNTGVVLPMRIIVPFCPESRLSGIGNTDLMSSVWYRREFELDTALRGRRIILCFGAVDYEARVWLNGIEVAHHKGGYTPFSTDITGAIDMQGKNEIVVCARDDIRSGIQPSGKQSHELTSRGCHYTRTTGIWQTVWLEAVCETHIASLTTYSSIRNGQAAISLDISGPVTGIAIETQVLADGVIVGSTLSEEVRAKNTLRFNISAPRLWDITDPFLYELRVRLVSKDSVLDEVCSYFGLRDLRLEGNRVFLNGRPIFLRMILDQGFWPQGIYTAPTDSELKEDIERGKAMGFNGARLHQKVFEPRTLYWADRLGYLVWAEFPDWGCSTQTSPEARMNFLREWEETVLRDRNHPSIIAWVPFNEARSDGTRYNPGFIREVRQLTKRLDSSRPVVDSSGYTHVQTDVWDLHDYDQNLETFRERYASFAETPTDSALPKNDPEHEPPYCGQPVVVSEYGGIWWNPGDEDETSWGYGDRPKTELEFLERFAGLTETLLDNPHIAGLCYTQLTDVEQEVNGLFTCDRQPKFPAETIQKIVRRKAAIEQW